MARGGRIKNLYGPDGEKIAYYQVNATYYSALGEDMDKMLMARALQLFMPGTPQIWYLDLFGGTNDYQAADADQGNHKEINRTNLTREVIQEKLNTPLVLKQIELLNLRAQHPAFNGTLSISASSENHEFAMKWSDKHSWVLLEVNLDQTSFTISHS